MNLEHDLRQALKRKEPPPGFSDRVLNKILASDAHVSQPPAVWRRYALPVVASLVLVAGGSFAVRQSEFQMPFARLKPSPTNVAPSRTDVARLKPSPTGIAPSPAGAQAARDVVLALQIASEKVSAAQTKVQEMTHHERHNHY